MYRLQFPGMKQEETVDTQAVKELYSSQLTVANSRRTFLATSATIAASLPIASAIAEGGKGKMNRKGRKKWPPLTPPGSISLERFKDKCTGCQICVVRCPSQVLRPTGLEYGLDYMLKPRLAYISSYCNYECTVCSDVCPTGAIKPLTIEEKNNDTSAALSSRPLCC